MDSPSHQPLDILGLSAVELVRAARKHLPSGAGVAKVVFRDAILRGRFAPEDHGVSAPSVAAWRRAFRVRLPAMVRRVEEPSPWHASTVKITLATADGLEIECVRVPMRSGRFTLCISSQIGCRLGCRFCETAQMGWVRNLTTAEIVSQVVVARAVLGWPIRNIVFMGMGEPLDNCDAVVGALRVLSDEHAGGFAHERLTICTAGIPEGLAKLAALHWKRLNLAVSLNAATDAKRASLMPIGRRVPLAALQAALGAYPRRRCFVLGINYCLLPGLNDSEADAVAVAEFARPLGRVLVNVIPYNPGSRPLTAAADTRDVTRFVGWLKARGVPANERVAKGSTAMAACGQLGNVALRHRAQALPLG